MFNNFADTRQPLEVGTVVEFPNSNKYIIDRYIGSGGFALTYIAHLEGTSKYSTLKEFFPRSIASGIAMRGKNGKIEIYDPLTQDIIPNNAGIWKRMSEYFVREAKLTEKATAVFDAEGRQEAQNNPDVFLAVGPFNDKIGNIYLIIDTAQGHPFRDVIESGFVKDESGQVLTNGNLLDAIGVLRDAARLLSRLHGSNNLLHLDISPDNIYVSYSSAGTALMPHIIDYGSAYDHKNSESASSHIFTCNSFSAPEIMALAELNDQDSGYQAGAFSDTYSIVSILFYALTGTIYSPNMAFDSRWKEFLQDEYAMGEDSSGRPLDGNSAEFTKKLIEVLETGLSADTKRRYQTADTLFNELSQLYKLYQTSGNLLSLLSKDELMSYLILDKYPLYAYRSESGNLDVLCLGGGEFVMRMILSMLSCGQMLNSHLNIHVVCQESKTSFCNRLLLVAPELENYSNLIKIVPEDQEYVTFEFETVRDITELESCNRLALKYSFCRYVIVSLGQNYKNINAARLYAKSISQGQYESDRKTIIQYYLAEDAANNQRSDVSLNGISPQVELKPFNNSLSSFAFGLRALGQRSLRVKYLYDKLSNPRCKFAVSAQNFVSDKYQQRSSCAAALHLNYKLASVEIDPGASRQEIISAYANRLNNSDRNALLELEHRRWMMYMIADGYRFPSTMSQIETYAFCRRGEDFNASFHDKAGRWHHCLVPCSKDGIRLSKSHPEWDQYSTYEEIEKTDYDKLDQMSLKVHLLAKKRVQNADVQKNLMDDLQNKIGAKIKQQVYILHEMAKEEDTPEDIQRKNERRLDTLRQHFSELCNSMTAAITTHHCTEQIEKLDILEYEFKKAGIDASGGFLAVREELKIFQEFEAYKDYKVPDLTIIEHLLWLMYADKNMVLIKLAAKTMLDDILGPVILDPKILIFFGREVDNAVDNFLKSCGNYKSIVSELCPSGEADTVFRKLEQLRKRFPGKCTIDITGADEVYITAAVWLAAKDKDVALLRSNNEDGKVENVSGFYEADIYQMNSCISADEIYQLYGASRLSSERGYMQELEDSAETLWKFYLEFRDNWEMVTAFFFSRGTGTSELRFKHPKEPAPSAVWRTYCADKVATSLWRSLKLGECFQKMEEAGCIRELRVVLRDADRCFVSFLYLEDESEQKVFKRFNYFFSAHIWNSAGPFTCIIQENDQEFVVSIQSGGYVWIRDQQGFDFADKRYQKEGSGKRFAYEQVIPALQKLEQLGFISNLSVPTVFDQLPVIINYTYENLAIKDCLMTSGNILELFIWYSARRTGKFDDCKANFTFQWEQGVKNELDLILTKGISTLVVSCKTAKFNKEHLYEIKYLTERFSLNSKAVIVYSSAQAIDENGHLTYDTSAVKERAKAMGVYLIDVNGVNADDLGKTLIDIAEGKSTLLN